MNGIEARLEEAKLLYEAGRYEGALLLALVALAATSRLRFPRGTKSRVNRKNKMGDREAFTTFLLEEINMLLGIPHLGKLGAVVLQNFCRDSKDTSDGRLENILYEYMRCNLVHSAELPWNVELKNASEFSTTMPTGLAFKFALPGEYRLILSYEVVPAILNVVEQASENRPS